MIYNISELVRTIQIDLSIKKDISLVKNILDLIL